MPDKALEHLVRFHLDVVNHIPLLKEAHARTSSTYHVTSASEPPTAQPAASGPPVADSTVRGDYFPPDLAEDDSDMWIDEDATEDETIEKVM